MKQYLLFMLALTSVLLAHAQNPGIPYQATLLAPETQLPGANSGLIPLKNTDVCLRFTFKSASGTEYQETQTATTSEFGRIDLVIGNGTPLSGSFAGINWDGNPKTMEVDIDYKGLCANFEPLAINEFQYVPYAFFALNAGGGSTTPPTITATANPTIPGDLTIGTNNLLINVDDADSDPTNEIELPLTAAINQVLTWDGSAWVAKNNPVDADSDPTNEIQDLSLTGNTLKITGNASATDINLAPYLDNTDNQIIVSADTGNLITAGTDLGALITSIDDADADPANEIQDLTITGNTLKITGNASATDINLAPYLDNTDNQIIVSADTGNLITAGTDLGALITSINDADADPANEIQDLTITGNTLKITGNVSATDINLAPYLDNTDNQIIVSADTGNLITAGTDLGALITSIDDADADPANEIQDLAIAANILKITGNASATDIDLSPYLDNTDNQIIVSADSGNLITVGTDLGALITSIDDADADPANEIQDLTSVLLEGNNANATSIENLLDPVNLQDAATKNYVDNAISNSSVPLATNTVSGTIFLTGALDGTASSPTLASDSVSSATILDGSIQSVDLANNAVVSLTITDGAITDSKLDKSNIPISGFASATTSIDLGGFAISNVATPTTESDAANKGYVDLVVDSTLITADKAMTRNELLLYNIFYVNAANNTVITLNNVLSSSDKGRIVRFIETNNQNTIISVEDIGFITINSTTQSYDSINFLWDGTQWHPFR